MVVVLLWFPIVVLGGGSGSVFFCLVRLGRVRPALALLLHFPFFFSSPRRLS